MENITNICNETHYKTQLQEHRFFNTHLFPDSEETWYIFGITLPIIVVLSLILNGLIFVVLLKDDVKSSLNLLLHCLSCYDIWMVLMSFWIFALPTLCKELG